MIQEKIVGSTLKFQRHSKPIYTLFIFLIILVKTQMKDGAVIDVEWSVEHAILLSQTWLLSIINWFWGGPGLD